MICLHSSSMVDPSKEESLLSLVLPSPPLPLNAKGCWRSMSVYNSHPSRGHNMRPSAKTQNKNKYLK